MLALAWGVLPAVPALLKGAMLGHPYTDLYPSVWGMWIFADAQPGFPVWTEQIGAPRGMGFYYSSPLHGWLAWPLLPVFGIVGTWNFITILFRCSGVLAAHWAGRAWGLGHRGAIVAAAIYGCSPFFQGYAVEGIAEGVISWALPLWLGFLAKGKTLQGGIAFFLTVIGSWYMAATACLLAALMPKKAWKSSTLGLLFAAPAIWASMGAFPEREALSAGVQQLMGTDPGFWTPGIQDGLNPFAKTSWLGFVALGLAVSQVKKHPRILAAMAGFWVLSLGLSLTSSLPLFSELRFPYRLHAGTLVLLAYLAGHAADRLRWGAWLAPLIVLEGLLLSPIEPKIPYSEFRPTPVYQNIEGNILLDIPGPLEKPPGEINPSRPWARWYLFGHLEHGMASPWRPDFNSIGTSQPSDDWLHDIARLHRHHTDAFDEIPSRLHIDASVDHIVLHHELLGRSRAKDIHNRLQKEGWIVGGPDPAKRTRYHKKQEKHDSQ